jgi:hypothetical protein
MDLIKRIPISLLLAISGFPPGILFACGPITEWNEESGGGSQSFMNRRCIPVKALFSETHH